MKLVMLNSGHARDVFRLIEQNRDFLIEYQGIPAGVIGFHQIDRPDRNAEKGGHDVRRNSSPGRVAV